MDSPDFWEESNCIILCCLDSSLGPHGSWKSDSCTISFCKNMIETNIPSNFISHSSMKCRDLFYYELRDLQDRDCVNLTGFAGILNLKGYSVILTTFFSVTQIHRFKQIWFYYSLYEFSCCLLFKCLFLLGKLAKFPIVGFFLQKGTIFPKCKYFPRRIFPVIYIYHTFKWTWCKHQRHRSPRMIPYHVSNR